MADRAEELRDLIRKYHEAYWYAGDSFTEVEALRHKRELEVELRKLEIANGQ